MHVAYSLLKLKQGKKLRDMFTKFLIPSMMNTLVRGGKIRIVKVNIRKTR